MQNCTNVNPDEYAAIKSELTNDPLSVGYAAMTSEQKATELSKDKSVANPVPAPQVPIPITGARLFSLLQAHLSPANLNKMFSKDEAALAALAQATDAAALTAWSGILVGKGDITQAEADAVVAAATTETQADPNHPANLTTNRLTEVTGRRNGGIADWEIDIVEAS